MAPAVASSVLDVRTPYGRPVAWAEMAMVTDIGDSHDLNDDRCLILTSRDLGEHASGPLSDFMLCLLADGATGSTFTAADSLDIGEEPVAVPAGWRASQLAQAAFVEFFLNSEEVDVLDRLKAGLRAADQVLVESPEGRLSTTLTALFLAADGTACAASIGDSVMLVLPSVRKSPGDHRLKKLGYEDTTAVGSGDTTLSYVDESELIEQWWPNKEGGHVDMRVRAGTCFVLMSDGISDNLPVDFIDRLVQRHTLESATIGLARHTRERRAEMQKRGGGTTSELGLDNMSAVVVRYLGDRRAAGSGAPRLNDAALVTVAGTHGGPSASSGGNFGLLCLADGHSPELVPAFLRSWIESEQEVGAPERLQRAFSTAANGQQGLRFAALVRDEEGRKHALASASPELSALFDVGIGERSVAAARDTALQRFIYSPRLWASTIATLAVFLLVSTAFATGTVRPAPPPVPTSQPGEPTPTPDTRPQLSFGGFQLVAPEALPTPTPPPEPEIAGVDTGLPPSDVGPDQAALNQPAQTTPARRAPPPPCANFFGIGCPAPPLPPPPPANRVIPVASPAASRPPAGSKLDDALQVASIADQRFERGLSLPPAPSPTPTSP